jgi:hypothetical protein
VRLAEVAQEVRFSETTAGLLLGPRDHMPSQRKLAAARQLFA